MTVAHVPSLLPRRSFWHFRVDPATQRVTTISALYADDLVGEYMGRTYCSVDGTAKTLSEVYQRFYVAAAMFQLGAPTLPGGAAADDSAAWRYDGTVTAR